MGLFNKGVGLLGNLKIRKKLLVALLPLALMVIAATLYSSTEMIRIDRWYSELIDRDVQALQNLTDARAKTTQFGELLYKEIAEPDPDRTRAIDVALDQTVADYHAYEVEARQESPAMAPQIASAGALFDQAVSDARSIRDNALKNDSAAAMQEMRKAVDGELQRSRNSLIDLITTLHAAVDRESDQLTARTHRTVAITWIVISLGFTASFAFAVFIVQKEVANRLEGFRGHILDVAEDRLDQPITNLERTDEIGEMSRALNTLQTAAQERQTQVWVKAEVATITGRLQSADSFEEFARVLLSRVSESVNLLYGIFYLAEADGKRFTAAGTFALGASTTPQSFSLGEGMAGQAALEQRSLEVIATDENQVRISAGAGTITGRNLLFMPMVSQGTVAAVLELAPVDALSARQRELLTALLPSAALNADILEGNLETKKLLEHTQVQAATVAAAEERSRLILTSVSEGIFGLTTEGVISFVNPAAAAMIGYAPEDLVGQAMHDRVHYARADGTIIPHDECSMFKTAQDGKARMVADEILWRKDGTNFPVEYSTTPIVRDGQVTGSVVAFRDITRRREAEKRLRFTQYAVDHAAETIFWVRPSDGGIEYANEAACRVLGFDRKELLGMNIAHLNADFSAEKLAHLLSELHEKGASTWETRHTARDGRPIDVEVTSYLAEYLDRQMLVVNVKDITERKWAEEEMRRAKEMAEAATRTKSDFLANMSHEIRTPMNAVIGMTHLALKTELTPKQHDYLSKIKSAAQTLLGILNDILDFSKIEAGKLDMEKTNFRLEESLENLSSIVGQKVQEKNLEFLISAQHDLPATLVGDPLRLGQILINLVNNAVKFTEQGQIVVTVALEERLADRVKVKFSVCDSGIGMTPDQSARMFQAFSQADTSTTRKYGGTGLGLSISKRLVELMEGTIWVESEYGKGSTFHFTAWFGVGSDEPDRKRFIPDIAGLHALVVDDNAQAREILTDSLRSFALRADAVSSGEDAIRELVATDAADPYQLILMDWHMPGMDGLQASRIIKRSDRLRHIPKIAMVTAFGREDIREQAEEIGIDSYLLKPVNPSLLHDALMDMFGVAEERASSPSRVKEDTHAHDASGVRVLLVEDNEMNRQVATELLQSAGAVVTAAMHGGEAVNLLTEGQQPPPFDVVFMDLQMPEMDGFTATKLLRADPRFESLPIIAMTAHALVEERQRCLEAGMNDHVSKPIDPDALFATLARWTKRSSQNGARPAEKASAAAVVVPKIDGVDSESGLRRVAENKQLYRSLLGQFAEKQSEAGARMMTAVEKGDPKLAQQIAHTVKGVAGNLGITKVQLAAGNIERAFREQEGAVPSLLEDFDFLLRQQTHAIVEALKQTEVAAVDGAGTKFDPDATATAMVKLKGLLGESDGAAEDAFTELRTALGAEVDAETLNAMGMAIRDFDFDGALAKLEGIAAKIKLNEGLTTQ
jgi:two-component system sensor histidine kinase/response regulator